MIDDTTQATSGGAASASSKNLCSICGKRLARYNRTGRCFHHPDLAQIRREKAKAEKLARELLSMKREQAKRDMAAVVTSTPSFSTLAAEIVVEALCKHWNVVIEQLLVQDRRTHIVTMRHVLMYLLYEDTALSYPQIGDFLGGRDHTTIMHGVEKVSDAIMLSDVEMMASVNKIRSLYQQLEDTSADPT